VISYTCVGTQDLDRARRFYEPLFEVLGAKLMNASDRSLMFGIDPKQPMFMVLTPYDGQAAQPGNGTMVALTANKAQVDALHAKALALGGKDEGAPGFRGDRYYMSYFRDLDGNKLAAFAYVKP